MESEKIWRISQKKKTTLPVNYYSWGKSMLWKQRDCFLSFQWGASVVKGTERDRIRFCHQACFCEGWRSAQHPFTPATPSLGLCQWLILHANLKMATIMQILWFANAEPLLDWDPTKHLMNEIVTEEFTVFGMNMSISRWDNTFKGKIWIMFCSISCVGTLIFNLMRC